MVTRGGILGFCWVLRGISQSMPGLSTVLTTAPEASASAQVCSANPDTAEIANSITHGLGLILSLIATAVLLHAARGADALQWTAEAIYAATMVAVYATST